MLGTTDFLSGFFGPAAIATKPISETKYMDWDKAKHLISEHPDSVIFAGLAEDWNNTSGLIYAKGSFYNGYVYGASCWATPILLIDDVEYECWTHEETVEKAGRPNWLLNHPDLKSEILYYVDDKQQV